MGTPGSDHRQPSGSGARTKPEVNLYLAQLIGQSEVCIVTSDQSEGSSVVSEQSEQPRSVYNQLSNCQSWRVFFLIRNSRLGYRKDIIVDPYGYSMGGGGGGETI